MCGFTGFFVTSSFATGGADPTALEQALYTATQALRHRGPDGQSRWLSPNHCCGLGHCRLAIQDLSPAGQQPMASACGRYHIAFNGEIYNADDLRRELGLSPENLRGHSDTEIMLCAIARWGLDAALSRFIGMFAFALWDARKNCLFLVRDRLGIKPLYWRHRGGLVSFGSELKSLRPYPGFTTEVDQAALCDYLKFGYISAPRSIYTEVQKQRPGTIICFKQDGSQREDVFWSMEQVVQRPGQKITSLHDAVAQTEPLLDDAVRRRMIADVRFGTFLSGGLDSSLITALMQKNSTRGPVRSFSIGFHHDGYDEAKQAKAIAQHLGTDHTELYVTERDLRDEVPKLIDVYDEPFADSSQIPTLLLSRLTRQSVTVALSGDGGDEVFAGYNRYLTRAKIRMVQRKIPRALRWLGAEALCHLPPALANSFAGLVLGRTKAQQLDLGRRLLKMGRLFRTTTPEAAYDALLTQWDGFCSPRDEPMSVPHFSRDEALFQYLDTTGYLPDDILTKVDRASMAHALEVRVPFLDHRVVEQAWTIDTAVHLHDGVGKRVSREILYKYVPKGLLDRPKQGFAVPLRRWLRGDLKDWAHSLLTETDWQGDLGLNMAPIHHAWTEHCTGRSDRSDHLWTVLMLAEWQRKTKEYL